MEQPPSSDAASNSTGSHSGAQSTNAAAEESTDAASDPHNAQAEVQKYKLYARYVWYQSELFCVPQISRPSSLSLAVLALFVYSQIPS